jgi:DnaJ-class molecular chaperone
MTPYAVLLVKPTDDDAVIRARFHELIRPEHPDLGGASGKPGENWSALTEAYGLVKTSSARQSWERKVRTLAGLCTSCQGFGVRGSRIGGGRITICPACQGEGRVMRPEKPRRKK